MRYIVLFLIFFSACKVKQKASDVSGYVNLDLDSLLIGHFDNSEQKDEEFKQYQLSIYPIFTSTENEKWYYLEEALTKDLRNPYKQEVLHFIIKKDKITERKFSIIDPHKYVYAQKGNIVLTEIKKEMLIQKEGCDMVFVKSDDKTKLIGITEGSLCESKINNATHSVSQIELSPNKITNWDRGLDGKNKQVWGTSSPYVYYRKR